MLEVLRISIDPPTAPVTRTPALLGLSTINWKIPIMKKSAFLITPPLARGALALRRRKSTND